MHNNSFFYLPLELELIYNKYFNNTITIKNKFIYDAFDYCLAFVINNENNTLLNGVLHTLKICKNQFISHIKTFFEQNPNVFYCICNGLLYSDFNNIDNFIFYMSNNDNIQYEYIIDILAIPNIFTPFGIDITTYNFKKNDDEL